MYAIVVKETYQGKTNFRLVTNCLFDTEQEARAAIPQFEYVFEDAKAEFYKIIKLG
mgnify:CR=1 FL=1